MARRREAKNDTPRIFSRRDAEPEPLPEDLAGRRSGGAPARESRPGLHQRAPESTGRARRPTKPPPKSLNRRLIVHSVDYFQSLTFSAGFGARRPGAIRSTGQLSQRWSRDSQNRGIWCGFRICALSYPAFSKIESRRRNALNGFAINAGCHIPHLQKPSE